jgi:hypothetical protein
MTKFALYVPLEGASALTRFPPPPAARRDAQGKRPLVIISAPDRQRAAGSCHCQPSPTLEG